MRHKKIIIISLIFFLIIIILGSMYLFINNQNNYNNNIKKQKYIAQINYIDQELTKIINIIDTTEFDNSVLNWDLANVNISKLYRSWNSIIIDFNNININNKTLTEFGRKLDELSIYIKNKNKDEALLKISELYSLLISYTNSIYIEEELKNDLYTKYYLIKAYSLLNTNNWTLINENIIKAEERYYNNINLVNNGYNNAFKKNKVYVSIKELENTAKIKDKDLFRIKYNIVLENIS